MRSRIGVTVTSIDGPDEAMKRYSPCGTQVYTVESVPPRTRRARECGPATALSFCFYFTLIFFTPDQAE